MLKKNNIFKDLLVFIIIYLILNYFFLDQANVIIEKIK